MNCSRSACKWKQKTRSREGEEGRRERWGNWPAVAAGEAHGGARWWRWFQAALLSVAVDSFFPPCLPLFSLCFFLFFFFSCSSFLSSSTGLFFSFFQSFHPLLYSLVLPPSVFIGKTEGRERQGRPMCSRPTTAQGDASFCFSLPRGRPRVRT